jgi:hypothetical protein
MEHTAQQSGEESITTPLAVCFLAAVCMIYSSALKMDTFLRKDGSFLPDYTTLYAWRQNSS